MSERRHLDADELLADLTPFMRRAAKEDYAARPPREGAGDFKHSREDYFLGYLAALKRLGSRSSFDGGKLPDSR